MIFDSGASAVVSLELANRLGFSLSAPHLESGTGNSASKDALTTVRDVAAGSLDLPNVAFDVMAMTDMPPVFGRVKIDGILGRPVFDRYTVQVDYDDHVLLFFEPQHFRPKPSDVPVGFTRIRDVPLINARLDGHSGMFGVDLGARSSLLLNDWFAQEHDLIPMFMNAPAMITGWGLGGPIYGKLARAHEFVLAGIKVNQPIVRLSTQHAGLLSRTDTAGLIGADILRQFTITFDPLRHLVYFRRSKMFGARIDFDRSGMWIIQNGRDAFKVIDVVPGGAAEQAGVQVDDYIMRINGHAAARLCLAKLREEWTRDPDGTHITLQIKRGQFLLEKTLQLKSLV